MALRGKIALADWRGQDAEADALVEARRRGCSSTGRASRSSRPVAGDAVRSNGLGRFDDALAAAERAAADPRGLGTPMWCWPS